MTEVEIRTLARVLARWYESAPTKSVAAAITVDLWEALRLQGCAPDVHLYWRAMDDARKAERAKWAALVAAHKKEGQ